MNRAHHLDRLLRAASRAPEDRSIEPAFGFDTRVLASLRASDAEDLAIASLWALVRKALICAGCIMLLSLAVTQLDFSSETGPDEADIAASAIELSLLP